MIHYVNIIVIKHGVVEEAVLLHGDNKEDLGRKAEKMFLKKCGEYMSDWDITTQENIDAALDNGYVEMHDPGSSICITWPEVRDEAEKLEFIYLVG